MSKSNINKTTNTYDRRRAYRDLLFYPDQAKLELTLRASMSGHCETPFWTGHKHSRVCRVFNSINIENRFLPSGGSPEALTALPSRKCKVPRPPFTQRRMLIRSNVPCHGTPGQESRLRHGFRTGPIRFQPSSKGLWLCCPGIPWERANLVVYRLSGLS